MISKDDALKKSNCFNHNHNNVTADIFRTTPFFDSRDVVQVKYEMIRAVSNAEGTITDISSAYGFSRKSFYQIREAFQTGGLYALAPKKTGPKKPHKLTPEASVFIDSFLADKPNTKSSEISAALKSGMGISVHPRTVYRHLKKN
jgi:transposase